MEALRRDGDALKRDVDRRMDSLRRDKDRQFRDGDRRVSSLERSRDAFENLFWFSMPLVAAVAVIIVLVIAVIASREQRQEPGEPEQRSPSSVDAPWVSSGGAWQPGLLLPGHLSDNIAARIASFTSAPGWCSPRPNRKALGLSSSSGACRLASRRNRARTSRKSSQSPGAVCTGLGTGSTGSCRMPYRKPSALVSRQPVHR